MGQQSASPNDSPLRAVVTGILCLGAIAAPLAFGATHVWAYCGLQMLVAVAVFLWSFSAGGGWGRWLLPLAVLMLGVAQLVPLPPSISELLAPETLSWRIVQASDRIGTQTGPATMNSARTVEATRRCLMLALVVVMAFDLAWSAAYRKWLLRSVAGAGAMILFLGLLIGAGPERNALGFYNRDGYWKFYKNPLLSGFEGIGMEYADVVTAGGIQYVSPAPIVGDAVGAMLNANHFAVCVGMTLPVVIGLMMASLSSATTRFRRGAIIGAACTYAAIAAYAIGVKAHSRVGVAGLVVIPLTLAAFAYCRTMRQRRIVIAVALTAALSVLSLALQFTKPGALGGRRDTWSAAIKMFIDSPCLGCGLGNYRTVYPLYRNGRVLASLAHSAWLELAAEAGLLGMAVVAVALGYGIHKIAIGWNANVPLLENAVRLGILGGLLFAAFHGTFDLSIQIPANAFLCALLVGILPGDLSSRSVTGAARKSPSAWSTSLNALFGASFAAILIVGGVREIQADLWTMPLREALALQRVPGNENDLDEKPELIEAALADAMRAFEIRPHDAAIADWLGQAHLHLSDGDPGEDLDLADEWLMRSLELCPINPWTAHTFLKVRAARYQFD